MVNIFKGILIVLLFWISLIVLYPVLSLLAPILVSLGTYFLFVKMIKVNPLPLIDFELLNSLTGFLIFIFLAISTTIITVQTGILGLAYLFLFLYLVAVFGDRLHFSNSH